MKKILLLHLSLQHFESNATMKHKQVLFSFINFSIQKERKLTLRYLNENNIIVTHCFNLILI